LNLEKRGMAGNTDQGIQDRRSCHKSIDRFLEGEPGWFIYNTHGVDDEGWGRTGTVDVLPAVKALDRLI